MARNLSNFLIFQAVWAACVLGAAAGHPWPGAGLGALLLTASAHSARRIRTRCCVKSLLQKLTLRPMPSDALAQGGCSGVEQRRTLATDATEIGRAHV